jgi:hypothetical protein
MAQMTGRRSSTLLSSAIVEHSLLTLSILGTHIAIEQLMIAWVATLRPADDLSSTSRTFSRFATLGNVCAVLILGQNDMIFVTDQNAQPKKSLVPTSGKHT